jgi:nitrogen regulation protein NR(I)
MATPTHVLLVDDDEGLAGGVQAVLESKEFKVTYVKDGDFAVDLLDEDPSVDVVLTDFNMPVMDGMELLAAVKERRPNLPVIIMTAFSTTQRAIEATKKGAFDYLLKPFEMPDLIAAVEKAASTAKLTAKRISLGKDDDEESDAIVGDSRPMQEVFKVIGRVAASKVPVLVTGETGTGKELVARALYQNSERNKAAFVAVNCAAIPESLIESELFGHERGAFTSAVSQRIGRFEQAHKGTLFLDEIGDLPLDTQAKLLRVLQEKTVTRVGGKDEISVDVRIICATHHQLNELVEEGAFREDLYYRINGEVIELPPLRERGDDIDELTNYLLSSFAREDDLPAPSIHRDAVKVLAAYDWPGNIRQLGNVLRRSLMASGGLPISAESIEKALKQSPRKKANAPESSLGELPSAIATELEQARLASEGDVHASIMDKVEREIFLQAISASQGNQSAMAKWLGLSRLTVRDKLDKYGLIPKRGSEK